MTEDSPSPTPDELRAAILNLAEGVRLLAIGLNSLAERLRRNDILDRTDSFWSMNMRDAQDYARQTHYRLAQVVDLLVKADEPGTPSEPKPESTRANCAGFRRTGIVVGGGSATP